MCGGAEMKYSFIIPYYKRPSFYNTLTSFSHFYKDRTDYEVIVIEDYKNTIDTHCHMQLTDIISDFSASIKIVHIQAPDFKTYNPCKAFNYGVNSATGEYLVITNPECMHTVDILNGFDSEFTTNSEVYVLCSCQASTCNLISKDFSKLIVIPIIWYQHTKHCNNQLHFCAALKKDNYLKIGGFDENFAKGCEFDDNDFKDKIHYYKIPMIFRDDLVVAHIEHDRGYIVERQVLKAINKNYYTNKWNTIKDKNITPVDFEKGAI